MAHSKPKMTPDRWLYILHQHLRPYFTAVGVKVPPYIELRCGWPRSRTALGQIWMDHAPGTIAGQSNLPRRRVKLSNRKQPPGHKPETPYYIFISPQYIDAVEVGAIVTHEMIHACVPFDGHKAPFQRICKLVGLVMTDPNGHTEIDDARHPWHNHPRTGAYTPEDNEPPKLAEQGVALRKFLTETTAAIGPYPQHKLPPIRTTPRPPERWERYKCPKRGCPCVGRFGPVALEVGTPRCWNPDCENYGGELVERKHPTAIAAV